MTATQDLTSIPAATAALVVVDMQNDFCHPDGYYASIGRDISALTGAIAGVGKMVDLARDHGVAIVFTELIHDDAQGAIEERHRIKPRKWSASGRRLVRGTWGAELVDECRPSPGDIVIQKHGYSAFEGTELEQLLRERGITTLVVCGVVTYACVLATVFSGFDKGFDVCLVSDAVGSWSDDLGGSSAEIVELLIGRAVEASQIEFDPTSVSNVHSSTANHSGV
jgi:ureidoacrylate peracid hydrolase